MEIPTKTLHSGCTMPVLGLGTWGMGGFMERDPRNDDARDIQAIKRAIDAGITHIDTAEMYAEGHTETLVGQAIKPYDRASLFIASKVQQIHLNYDDVLRSCEASLKRLDIDQLDLYLLHRYGPDLQGSVRALDTLVDRGLVKHIGVSNFTKAHLADAQKLATHPIVCNQMHYNLKFREAEVTSLLEYCQTQDIFLSAWRPVEKGGLLTNAPAVVQDLCQKYDKTPAQIALNWLLSQKNVVTLFQTRSPEHLQENLGSLGWQLSEDDIERLRRDYPDQLARDERLPLG